MKVKRVFGVTDDSNWVRVCSKNHINYYGIFKAVVKANDLLVKANDLLVTIPNYGPFYSTLDSRWEVVKNTSFDLEKWV